MHSHIATLSVGTCLQNNLKFLAHDLTRVLSISSLQFAKNAFSNFRNKETCTRTSLLCRDEGRAVKIISNFLCAA